MSEITKLYENAGIEKEVIKGCYEYYSENGGIDIYTVNDCKNKDCNTCKADKSIKEYPPFTAEKQIEILKLLTNRCDLTISHFTEWEFIHFDGQEPTQVTGKDFTETFAKLINAYWQDLTEEEKMSIKNILEI
jgi:hypothetical protein